MTQLPIRQGDVLLIPVTRAFKLPADAQEVLLDRGRIVLAYGEVTGHAHAIADLVPAPTPAADEEERRAFHALEIASAVIERVRLKARLYRTPAGERFLVVDAPVTLTHEEHTAHKIPPGVYRVPTQVEYTPAELRTVAD